MPLYRTINHKQYHLHPPPHPITNHIKSPSIFKFIVPICATLPHQSSWKYESKFYFDPLMLRQCYHPITRGSLSQYCRTSSVLRTSLFSFIQRRTCGLISRECQLFNRDMSASVLASQSIKGNIFCRGCIVTTAQCRSYLSSCHFKIAFNPYNCGNTAQQYAKR